MKKLLVTGGAGFIGSNYITKTLNEFKDYFIVNLDALTYAGNLNNLKTVKNHGRYLFEHGDIRDVDRIEQLFKEHDFDYVINFAAESHVDRSIENPSDFLTTNILGTHNLLSVAKKYWSVSKQPNVKFKEGVKFIQISTDEVYGSLGKEGYFTEQSPIKPNSPYAASKASADHLVWSYFHTYGFPMNITRCSNNYGPNQYPEKLIPLMIQKAKNNESLPVYGDGSNVRDWIHVEDHVDAINLVLSKGKMGEVYNVGGNNELTNLEIVKMILDALEKPYELINFVDDRLGHDYRYAIDASKILDELGWKPKKLFSDFFPGLTNIEGSHVL